LSVALVWAQAANGVIGADGALPWQLPEDLQHFKRLTMGATVVMGRTTWESLPTSVRPLPGRTNVVLTRDPTWSDTGAEVARSLDAAIAAARDVWVIGGSTVFAAAIERADRVVRTDLEHDFEGDAFAPVLDATWQLLDRDPPRGWHRSATGLRYRVTTFARDVSERGRL
jgi:dihydrofolate reductase